PAALRQYPTPGLLRRNWGTWGSAGNPPTLSEETCSYQPGESPDARKSPLRRSGQIVYKCQELSPPIRRSPPGCALSHGADEIRERQGSESRQDLPRRCADCSTLRSARPHLRRQLYPAGWYKARSENEPEDFRSPRNPAAFFESRLHQLSWPYEPYAPSCFPLSAAVNFRTRAPQHFMSL